MEQGPPGPAGAIKVYDANNQYLGIFLGWYLGDAVEIYSSSDNIVIGISQATGEIRDELLYFLNDNCLGIPYIDPVNSNKIVRNSGAYYVGEKIAPSDIQVTSRLQEDLCSSFALNRTVVPASEVVPSFTLPVALPLRLQ